MVKAKRLNIVFIILAGLTTIINITGAFLLPSDITTNIFSFNSSAYNMGKAAYLVLTGVLVGICSAAGIFLPEKSKRYLFLGIIIFGLNITIIVLNLI